MVKILTIYKIFVKISPYFCGNSSVVEHNLAKVGVASSNLVSRSIFILLTFFITLQADEIKLKEHYCIDGDFLMLLDLKKDAKIDIKILEIPNVSKFQIPSIKLKEILNTKGFKVENFSENIISITKNCTTNSNLKVLENALKSAYEEAYEEIEFKDFLLLAQNSLPKDDNYIFKELNINDANLKKNRGSFSAIFLDERGLSKRVFFKYEIKAFISGVKAKNNLSKGTILTPYMVEKTKFELSNLSDYPLLSIEDNEWKIRHFVKEGTLLLRRHIDKKPLLLKQEFVHAVIKDGGLELSIPATALTSGDKGDRIRVRSSDGKIYNATVISSKKVLIVE